MSRLLSDSSIANAKNDLAYARKSAVIAAFMAVLPQLAGALAAWFAAVAGAQHRDDRSGTGRWTVFLGRRAVARRPTSYAQSGLAVPSESL